MQCERKVPTGPLEERPQDHGAGVPGALPRYKGKTDFFLCKSILKYSLLNEKIIISIRNKSLQKERK